MWYAGLWLNTSTSNLPKSKFLGSILVKIHRSPSSPLYLAMYGSYAQFVRSILETFGKFLNRLVFSVKSLVLSKSDIPYLNDNSISDFGVKFGKKLTFDLYLRGQFFWKFKNAVMGMFLEPSRLFVPILVQFGHAGLAWQAKTWFWGQIWSKFDLWPQPVR